VRVCREEKDTRRSDDASLQDSACSCVPGAPVGDRLLQLCMRDEQRTRPHVPEHNLFPAAAAHGDVAVGRGGSSDSVVGKGTSRETIYQKPFMLMVSLMA